MIYVTFNANFLRDSRIVKLKIESQNLDNSGFLCGFRKITSSSCLLHLLELNQLRKQEL